jgi:hypothetical protein
MSTALAHILSRCLASRFAEASKALAFIIVACLLSYSEGNSYVETWTTKYAGSEQLSVSVTCYDLTKLTVEERDPVLDAFLEYINELHHCVVDKPSGYIPDYVNAYVPDYTNYSFPPLVTYNPSPKSPQRSGDPIEPLNWLQQSLLRLLAAVIFIFSATKLSFSADHPPERYSEPVWYPLLRLAVHISKRLVFYRLGSATAS